MNTMIENYKLNEKVELLIAYKQYGEKQFLVEALQGEGLEGAVMIYRIQPIGNDYVSIQLECYHDGVIDENSTDFENIGAKWDTRELQDNRMPEQEAIEELERIQKESPCGKTIAKAKAEAKARAAKKEKTDEIS